MAMPIVVVEVQNLVGVPHRLFELARPIIATACNCVCGDEQVGIAGRLREVQHLLRPGQGFSHAPLRQDVWNIPQRMGASASWRSSDLAKARAG